MCVAEGRKKGRGDCREKKREIDKHIGKKKRNRAGKKQKVTQVYTEGKERKTNVEGKKKDGEREIDMCRGREVNKRERQIQRNER